MFPSPAVNDPLKKRDKNWNFIVILMMIMMRPGNQTHFEVVRIF